MLPTRDTYIGEPLGAFKRWPPPARSALSRPDGAASPLSVDTSIHAEMTHHFNSEISIIRKFNSKVQFTPNTLALAAAGR